MITRRVLIRTSLLGSAGLAAASTLGLGLGAASLAGCSRAPSDAAAFAALPAWQDAHSALFEALAPAVIGSACATPSQRQAAVQGVRAAVEGLSPAAQRELHELLGLLGWAPARWALTGLRQDWPQVTPEQASAFLARWRHSPLELLQSAYHALHDLLLGGWYAQPASWPAIGYPGPPTLGARP